MSNKKNKVKRLLVLSKSDCSSLMQGGDWSVIQSYSSSSKDFHTYARDCAKVSSAMVVCEYDSGDLEVISDFSQRRREPLTK